MTIGDYRAEQGLKIEELAKLLRISNGHASDICNGKQPVSIKIAKRMAAITGKPWHSFIDEKHPQPSKAA